MIGTNFKDVTDNPAIRLRAINGSLLPCFGKQGAMICTVDNETCSRPPTDLRGNPAAHAMNDAAEL